MERMIEPWGEDDRGISLGHGPEGAKMDWKHWDGLADEQGPIPAFGPARADEHGRVVMTDEEWEARRDAATPRSGR
jgi:hypothetical protein